MSKIHPISLAPAMVASALVSSKKILLHGGAGSLAMEITARTALGRGQVRYVCGENCLRAQRQQSLTALFA